MYFALLTVPAFKIKIEFLSYQVKQKFSPLVGLLYIPEK